MNYCESPTYSDEQPDLPCPWYGIVKHGGKWWCEYHYLLRLTEEGIEWPTNI
jgi:hypothetical protein